MALRPSQPDPPSVSEEARIGLTWRVPLPPLALRDLDGRVHELGRAGRAISRSLPVILCVERGPSQGEEVEVGRRLRLIPASSSSLLRAR